MQETPTPVSFNLVLALTAKRVALGKSQTTACLDVSTAFLHAEVKDEVYVKMDADTLRMIREEILPNLQPFDNEGFCKVDKALRGYRGSPRYWGDAVSEAAKALGLKPSKIDNSLYMESRKFHSVRARGRRTSLWKLKQKFFVKKVDYLAKVWGTQYKSWVGKWKEQK